MEPTDTPQAAATDRILMADHPCCWISSLLVFKISSFDVTTVFISSPQYEKGYFSDSLEEFALRFHLELSQAEALLALIQSLEPAGIGARTLEECLCIQLEQTGELTTELKTFIHSNLSLIAKNQLTAIARKEKLPLAKVKAFCERIKQLNPKPGAAFGTSIKADFIVPDVIAEASHGHIKLCLNESMYPGIGINSYYMQLFQETSDKEVQSYLQQKIRQVEWLQQCITQRDSTLLSVAGAILTMQQEFFLLGPDHLKPLKQADIAAYLDIHVSTVSRACSKKYLQCSWGIIPLTAFFVKMAPSKDNSQSTVALDTSLDVQKALIRLIEHEDKSKPYSDRILAELLASQGFSISRRTVAKYRETLSIPGTTGRKIY